MRRPQRAAPLGRRGAAFTLLGAAGGAAAGAAGRARADVVKDVYAAQVRSGRSLGDAATDLLYARAVLLDLERIAEAGPGGAKGVNAKLPAYGKLLSKVGPSTPVVVGEIFGGDGECNEAQGCADGSQGQQATNAVYRSVGRVITASGKSIQPAVLEDPSLAADAAQSISKILDALPEAYVEELKRAANQRK